MWFFFFLKIGIVSRIFTRYFILFVILCVLLPRLKAGRMETTTIAKEKQPRFSEPVCSDRQMTPLKWCRLRALWARMQLRHWAGGQHGWGPHFPWLRVTETGQKEKNMGREGGTLTPESGWSLSPSEKQGFQHTWCFLWRLLAKK